MRFLVAGAGAWGTAFTHVLRERFELEGVPVAIDFVQRG